MTTTFKSDIFILTSVIQDWPNSTSKVSQVTGITYALTFHVLPPAIPSKSAPLGGNSLGLDPFRRTFAYLSADHDLELCNRRRHRLSSRN